MKYHFLPEEGSPSKVIVTLPGKTGSYRIIGHYEDEQKTMTLNEGRGSLVLVDKTFQSSHPDLNLNKLHTYPKGSRLKFLSPHAEDSDYSNEVGPRLDLHMIDGGFAEMWTEELEKWGDQKYVDNLIDSLYGTGKEEHFNVPYRRSQVMISPDGLKQKIEETMKRADKQTAIFHKVDEIRSLVHTFFSIAGYSVYCYVHTGGRNAPKIIISPAIYKVSSKIRASLDDALSLIDAQMDPEIEELVKNYWEYVAMWETL